MKSVSNLVVLPWLYCDERFKGEKFADTKKRLQARIGASDKDFAKYRFALIQVATFKQPSYIEDGERFTSLRKLAVS